MKTLKTLFLFPAFTLLASCTIQGTFQGLFSYYKNVNSKNPRLLKHLKNSALICNASYSDSCKVIVTTGKELKKCASQNDKSIVYIWGAHCKSGVCYPLDGLQNICTEKGITLYIVAEYYDSELMNKGYNIEHPIFGIDTKYYKTNLTEKYLSKFFYELTGVEHTKDRWGRIIYLENGNYIGSYRLIEDIKSDSTTLTK